MNSLEAAFLANVQNGQKKNVQTRLHLPRRRSSPPQQSCALTRKQSNVSLMDSVTHLYVLRTVSATYLTKDKRVEAS